MDESNFDYEGAVKAGYSDEEILDHLVSSHPDFDVNNAFKSGYSSKEINEYLSSRQKPEKVEERGAVESALRVAGQYGLGAIEGSAPGFSYDVAVAPLASKEAQTVNYRENLFQDIERLQEQKQTGVWDEQDQALYENLIEQAKDTSKSEPFVQTADLSIRGLLEKATGLDLHPEGVAEKAANWAGFIKDPKNLFELGKSGLNAKDFAKAIAPTGREALRGLGAGFALDQAEKGGFGPIGTMAAAVLGDISGNIGASAAKAAKRIITEPRKVLAEVAAKFTPKDKLDIQKDIIKDFRDSGIQADIGTSTNNNLMKWFQSRLAQSGLTGSALDDLKKTLTDQVKEEYKGLAESIGEARFETAHEAGEIAKTYLKEIRDTDLSEVRGFYKAAEDSIKEGAAVDSKKLANEIERVEKALKPGNLKSSEQTAVLDVLNKIKRDIYDSEGNLLRGKVKDLMNNKTALNDIINYEVQGGTKQLLKSIVGELDRAIISYGKENETFAKNYIKANQRFSKHAKEFRNKRVAQLLRDNDPAQLINRMNSVQGIRDLENILYKTGIGKSVMDSLKRFKLDKMIGDNLVDSSTQQIKLGTFSKLLEKGKNRDIAKEILPKGTFKRLERLQKNAGRLAETANKFLNTSKTAVITEDVALVVKALSDIGNFLSGNPWPLIRTGAGLTGARYITKLMGDPEFLRMVEDLILAANKNDPGLMAKIGKQMISPIRAALQETNKRSTLDENRKIKNKKE